MNPYYNQNYTKAQIEAVLSQIKQNIASDRYTISLNDKRQENIDFIHEYNLRSDRQKAILLQIKTTDFCHSVQNKKPGFEQETLYVFVPQVPLFRADGIREVVAIYTKFNIIRLPSGSRTIVISFHRLNKPITYLFSINQERSTDYGQKDCFL